MPMEEEVPRVPSQEEVLGTTAHQGAAARIPCQGEVLQPTPHREEPKRPQADDAAQVDDLRNHLKQKTAQRSQQEESSMHGSSLLKDMQNEINSKMRQNN